VITCDPAIGADAAQLFNHLTGYSRAHDYETLLVAPRDLRRQLTDLIEHEATFGAEGEIVIKCNSIADKETVEALYAASAAGTRIEMLVRGICCLRPGVPGLSENIRVRSILGRYLEHSRIFRFKHGNVVHNGLVPGADTGVVHLMGSADLMPRNLDRRVEVIVPIENKRHREWLDQALAFQLADGIVAWEMQPDNIWARVGPTDVFEPHAQEQMYRWTVEQQLAGRR
jgi:polyphosphate kinase